VKLKKKKLSQLLEQLEEIKEQAVQFEIKYYKELEKVHPSNLKSAKNLIHYLALRNQDIREIQNALWQLGISRLGRAESHVMASIISVQNILQGILNELPIEFEKPEINFNKGRKILKANTSSLLGKKLKGSKVRIMVTLPTEAADDYKLVRKLFNSGMNSARINCAHDDAQVWERMIKNIKKAKKQTGRNCKICMDLGGPKLRTGSMRQGPKVVHLTPERDLLGKVTSPAEAWLVPEGSIQLEKMKTTDEEILIPLPEKFLNSLKPKDEIVFTDSRGKDKKLVIDKKFNARRLVRCFESAYIKTGTTFTLKSKHNTDGVTANVGELLPLEESIILKQGDKLIIHSDSVPGEPAEFNSEGELIKPAHISCTLPEIFNDVKSGELIILDDGKIEGVIRTVEQDKIEIEITYSKEEGTKLRADKGINLPESKLSIKGLTEKDRSDLNFIAKNADVVNCSFVNSAEDVNDILDELKKLDAEEIGIILKIETRKAFENLPAILFTAMQHYPVGIMIARGDLAIECGWKDLAIIQEEIMWLCESAHLPIIWATQVLETMAKKGRPSRAEITDAAFAGRAESVMLNKGPFIFEAIKILDVIISSMQDYQEKKAPMMPKLKLKKQK
jgi:pyruvate kinase